MSERPKVPSHALLLNLPEDRQEQIAEWCDKPNDRDEITGKPIPKTGGLAFAREQLAHDGLKVSLDTLSRFFSAWKLERDLDLGFDVERQVLERTGDAQKAREASEAVLLRIGLARQDPELILAAAKTHDSRRKLDLDEKSGKTKAQNEAAKIDQKEREIGLAQQKFQRDTCRLFLDWFSDEQAKTIATGGGTNAEKIEALGRKMFGEDWDAA